MAPPLGLQIESCGAWFSSGSLTTAACATRLLSRSVSPWRYPQPASCSDSLSYAGRLGRSCSGLAGRFVMTLISKRTTEPRQAALILWAKGGGIVGLGSRPCWPCGRFTQLLQRLSPTALLHCVFEYDAAGSACLHAAQARDIGGKRRSRMLCSTSTSELQVRNQGG